MRPEYRPAISKLVICFIAITILGLYACLRNSTTRHDPYSQHISPFFEKETKTITVKATDADQRSYIDIIDSFSIVILETTPESLIRRPNKVIVTDDKVFIKDQDILHIFRSDGKHISTISNRGRGPTEYTQLNDFCFLKASEEIVISSHSSVHYYNLDGNFIKKVSTPWRVFYIDGMDDRFTISPITISDNIELNYNLVLTDKSFNILDRRDKLPIWEGPFFSWTGTEIRSHNLSDEIIYASYHGDSIYRVTKSGIELHRIINFDNKHHVTGVQRQVHDIYSHIIYRESKKHFTLSYSYNEESYFMIYEKDSKDSYAHIKVPFAGFDNINDNGPYMFVRPGNLKETLLKLERDNSFCSNIEVLEEGLKDEFSHNGFILFFSWKASAPGEDS